MPRLYILSGPDLGKSVDVADGATVGRAAECAVYLRDPSVSRQHARLERSGDGWRIVDTQSRNGVSVRGARVPAAGLSDGEEFLVGEVHLRFRLGPGDRPVTAELEEISLAEDPPPAPVPATPLERTATSIPRPGAPELRGPRILQYKRIPDREGFFGSDLAQQPLWIRLGAVLLALALFGAIFLFAFKGTSMLKARTSEIPEEPSR